MSPILFDGCFGWFHPAQGRRGVVLCGPLGQEVDFVHRSWRRLAEQLAARGLPTLRFDYRGLGDSLEDDESPARIRTWIGNVKNAALWLQATHGVDEIILLGIRFGGALAAAAAAELGGVEGLVLLAPVVSGRAYRRELTMMAKMGQKSALKPGDDLSVGGLTYTRETLADLERFEPFKAGGPLAPRVLTLTPPGLKMDRLLTDRFATGQIAVEDDEFAGYSDLMKNADFAVFPTEAFARVVDWAAQDLPVLPAATTPPAQPVQLALPGAKEQSVTLGGARRLFGIACTPEAPARGAPAIVLLNTGATRHTGTGRMSVAMARRFALFGLTSLRFDVAGVGDSPDRPGQRDPVEHIADSFGDVDAALDWLEAQGHSSVILIGFCRGAQLACNMAFRDRRVSAQILIGPPQFFWSDGPLHRAPQTTHRYLQMASDPNTWSGLVKGEIHPTQIAKGAVRLAGRIIGRVSGVTRGKSEAEQVAERLRSLKDHGIETLMVYGDKDIFLLEMEEFFTMRWQDFPEMLGAKTVILDGADHLFLKKSDRTLLIDAIAHHFAEGSHPWDGSRIFFEEPAPSDAGAGSADEAKQLTVTPHPRPAKAALQKALTRRINAGT